MPLISASVGQSVAAAGCVLLFWILGGAIYNLFFHPLRSYPGPMLNRISRIPYCLALVRGRLPQTVLQMHEKYGRIVRMAPNELAFNDSIAWKDIMGHKSAGLEEFSKSPTFYRTMKSLPPQILSADRDEHAKLRRQLSHGFSERSLREQEPLIKGYVDLLLLRLQQHCNSGPLDLSAWFNYTTFDIIGDLAFGEPFGCLEKSQTHPWVKNIFGTAQFGTFLQAASHFPRVKDLLMSLIPKSMGKKREEHRAFTKEMLLRRMELDKERPDLIEGLIRKKDDLGFDFARIQSNAGVLVIAGSETTATLLAGVTYLLLNNPEPFAKLTTEIRSSFRSDEEINVSSAGNLRYLLACLDEALRIYPPTPVGFPRVAPAGGAMVSGHYVPENTIVAMHNYAIYHSAANFLDPFGYHPERFLGDARFAKDDKDALQPFHVGPRSCLGRNLAYAEMRLIMARLIYNFDLEIAEQSRDWMLGQKVFNFWEKPPLLVHVKPVIRGEAKFEP